MRRVEHHADCASSRLERTDSTAPDRRRVTVIRCLDCGGQLVLAEVERRLDADERAELWELDPARLARSLTPAERLDPALNPLHPAASSWPPSRTPTLPSTYVETDPLLHMQLTRRQS